MGGEYRRSAETAGGSEQLNRREPAATQETPRTRSYHWAEFYLRPVRCEDLIAIYYCNRTIEFPYRSRELAGSAAADRTVAAR